MNRHACPKWLWLTLTNVLNQAVDEELTSTQPVTVLHCIANDDIQPCIAVLTTTPSLALQC